MGCLVEARFPRPVLLQAGPDEAPVALALLNGVPTLWASERLLLGESGDPALDGVFIEHNGPLLARGHEAVLPDCMRALLSLPIAPRRRARGRRLRLSGVSDAVLQVARAAGTVRTLQSRPAPYVDFAALGSGEDAFLAGLSANARYQLRRSLRRYREIGSLVVRRAESVAEALRFLQALAGPHQATWHSRGRAGAFANPAFLSFHQALVARALPRDEVDLLCITAGNHTLGYLYNFVFRCRVSTYQSGFDYAAAGPHQKPGLTSHYMAIEMYRQKGCRAYDFLAGQDRYKTTHANGAVTLHWLDVAQPARWRSMIPCCRRA
jgi:CelD/BcsL family acetyltransferase involved in cellulose biosynthesis